MQLGMSAMGQKRTHAVQQEIIIRSLRQRSAGDLQHVETERLGGALVGRLRAPQAVQTAVDEPGEGRRPGENGDDHEQLRQRQQERRLQDLCHVVCGDGVHAQWENAPQ
jgi:hypothetical protein